MDGVDQMVERVRKLMEDMPSFMEGRIVSCQEEIAVLTDVVVRKLEGFLDDLRILKWALRLGLIEERTAFKVKVLERKPFEGARSSKELENFKWDMETYFRATRVPDEKKISITSMYLSSDAKLWCDLVCSMMPIRTASGLICGMH